MPSSLHGVDKSRWNAAIPLPADVGFFFVRASYGLTADPRAADHLAVCCTAREVVLGLYHYLATGPNAASPEEQASFFVLVSQHLTGGPFMLAVDCEPIDPAHPDDPARVADFLVRFRVAAQAKAGRPIGVYLGGNYARSLPLPAGLATSPLWLADWTPPWDVPPPWSEWTIIQAGVKGGIDRDEFAGTADELRAVFGLLDLPSVDSGRRTLRRGDVGGDVHELQLQLNRRAAALAVDGRWGPATDAAVRAFQEGEGLRVDGIVGPATWRALLSG